jgi:hypothetical protein
MSAPDRLADDEAVSTPAHADVEGGLLALGRGIGRFGQG